MFLRKRDERGAVAIVVGAASLVLVLIAAFAVDLGMQRVARRDMQSLSDIVALDLVRELDGRPVSTLKPLMPGLATASRLRNKGTLGDTPSLDVDLGEMNDNSEFVELTAPAAVPTAVRVTAETSVGFAFVPGEGGAVRSAVGSASSSACFRIGSFALGLDSSNSALLNSLIGDALNLGVLGYDGLATADISLLGLAAELGAGTTDELMALPNLSLNDLYLAAATVLQNEGGDTADIDLLNNLAHANLGALPHISLADLIALAPGDDSALGASVNVLDLVAGAAFIANGENFLAIPNLTIGIPGIATVTASLKVIQAPQLACGPIEEAHARTSQIQLDLDVKLLDTNLGVPGLASVRAATKLHVSARVGDARGTLKKIICGDGTVASPEGIDVSVATALTQITLGLDVDVSAILLILRVPVAKVTATLGTTEPPETNLAQLRVPPLDYETPLETGAGTVGLAGLQATDLHVSLLGIGGGLLGGLTNGLVNGILTPIVNPLIGNLDNLLLGPLTDLLGLNVAGADLFIGDGTLNPPRRPDCAAPRLVG
jgi:uncharacterized membrane protein